MLNPNIAQHILTLTHTSIHDDFHALSSDTVQTLLAYADSLKYRKPRNANGSRARYFFAYLQRAARRA